MRSASAAFSPPSARELAAGYDAVINTVPARIAEPCDLPRGAIYIELASPPHGIDTDAARAAGIDVRLASGLPGKYAPASAAALIADCVRRRLGAETEEGGGAT